MVNKDFPETPFEPTYRSGVAARLAEVPVETLRVWERRYGVVGPRLGPRGHRLYSAEDVSRLALIKQLVDLGSQISAVARLPLADLRAMRTAAEEASEGRAPKPRVPRQPVRVVLLGEGLATQATRASADAPTLEIVARRREVTGAGEALQGVAADVLVIELPTLQSDAPALVAALTRVVGARRAVVAYRFSSSAVLGALRDQGHSVARAPIAFDELERLCADAAAPEVSSPRAGSLPVVCDRVPLRRFDDRTLVQVARASTNLNCECPHHVVELLHSLGAFERYSGECVNRSPQDAELHGYLQRVAGTARALFEEALVRIARAEGLALPAHQPSVAS